MSLGAKESVLQQQKMPLSHRRGIATKSKQREDKRRREAKENGIILETVRKTTRKGKLIDAKRQRGIGGPSVGRFQGGMLRLSTKDVRDIEGPGARGKARKGRWK
jgi:hypothetical protein